MNDMEIQMQTLSRDLETAKNKVASLAKDVDFGELERLKLEEKLQKYQRRCEELEETVTRLLEEKKVSADREKRAEELCHKVSSENSKMAYEFHSSTSELKETIRELKDKNLESERLAGVFQERYKRFDTMVVKMDQEIEDLKREKSAAIETIEELRRENLEAKKTVDELRLEKLESDKVADTCKSKLENLTPRIEKIEENLADMLATNLGDLTNFANSLRALATNSEDFPESKGKYDNDSKGKGAENGVIVSTSNSKKGDMNSDKPCSRGEAGEHHDADDTVKTSCGLQIGHNSPNPEKNGCKEPRGLGAHASGMQFMSGEGCFSKITCSPSVAGDIIMISDSDDEAKPIGAVDISNVGENQMKIIQSPPSGQSSKRSRTEDLFANSTERKGTCTQAMRKSGCVLAEYMVGDNMELRRKKSAGSEERKTESSCHQSVQKAH